MNRNKHNKKRKPYSRIPAMILRLPSNGDVQIIFDNRNTDAMLKAVVAIGINAIAASGIHINGGRLVVAEPEGRNASGYMRAPDGRYVQTRISPREAMLLFQRIARRVGVPLTMYAVSSTWTHRTFVQPQLPFMDEPPTHDLKL